jgi:DNA-binding winged helix-turn-helix (wHTH) protein
MTRSYSFGEFRVIPASREVWRADKLVALPPPVFDCLTYLLEHHARAVGRDELVAAVWGKTEVSDTLLGQTILRIRREVGDDAKEQRLLRTIPRFGYRWVGPFEVSEMAAAAKPAAPADAAPESAQNDELLLPLDASNDSVPPSAEPEVVAAPPEPTPIAAPTPTVAPVPPDLPPRPAAAPRFMRPATAAIALAAVVAVMLLGIVFWSLRHHHAAPSPIASEAAQGELVSAVLPAVVEPGAEWAWMRLGMMDAVATHLRNSGLPSVPSEDVVALLKAPETNRGGELRDALGARLLVTPRVKRAGANDWQVSLDADDGAYRKYSVEGHAADAAAAARAATDKLIVALGRSPAAGTEEDSAEATLVRRIDAAALADDLEGARALVAQASPEEQQSPEVRLRLAKIDFRAGNLEAARKRLEAMLEEAPAGTAAILRASILNGLGAVTLALNEPKQAERFFAESIPLLESHPNPEQLGQAYLGRAAAATDQRQFDVAAADYARARIAYRQANDQLALIRVAADEGFVDFDQRRPARALTQFVTATEGFKQWGALNEALFTYEGQIACHLVLLEGHAAMQAADAAEAVAQRVENRHSLISLKLARARALVAVGRLREGRALLDAVRTETTDPITAAAAETAIAKLELDANQPLAADDLAQHAVSVMTTANHAALRSEAWLTQVRAELRGGDRSRVTSTLTAFESWAGDSDEPRARLFARLARAEYARKFGAGGDWHLAFADARDLAGRDGIPYEIATVAKSYVDALLAEGDLDAAAVEVGRVSRWSDQDFGCAVLEARLYAATGRNEARQTAVTRAQALAGERSIPPDALSAAISTRAAKQ